MAIAATKNLEIIKFEVKTEFFDGGIDKKIYLEQPEGYIDTKKPTHVLKLLRNLHEVRFSKKFNFKSFGDEKCVFVGEINNVGVLV